MKRPLYSGLLFMIFALLLNGCATTANHPTLKGSQLPALIPLRHLVVNRETSFNYRISPDGLKLGWIAVKAEILTVHFKQIGGDKVTTLSPTVPGSIFGFVWTPDSQRLLYWQDQSGNENDHIYLADSDHPDQPAVDLTAFENIRAGIHQIVRTDPDNVLITHNNRDKTAYDLYQINLKTRKLTMLAQNPGGVLFWLTEDEGNLRARVRKNDEETRIFEIFNSPEKQLESIDAFGFGRFSNGIGLYR